jgi:hypothetical protein
MDTIGDFIKGSKGLTRNPLGIIALFVSLIYGFACLVLSTSISNLKTADERLPLIWFIICFPIIILIAFIFIVVKHHEKLYAPSDFRGDDSFIQTIDKGQLRDKQLKEVKILESAPITDIIPTIELENKNINEEQPHIDNKANLLQNQDKQEEQNELTEDQLVEIYSKAENWAAQELSLKHKVLLRTNVKVSSGNGTLELDAYGSSSGKVYVAEIKYWQTKKSYNKLKLSIQEYLAKSPRIIQMFPKSKELILIIVVVFDNLKIVDKENLTEFITSVNSDIVVEFFDYNDLRKNYE